MCMLHDFFMIFKNHSILTEIIDNSESTQSEGAAKLKEVEHLFNFGPEIGHKSVEGHRVQQLATIFRNLSFEECNMGFLSTSPLFFR